MLPFFLLNDSLYAHTPHQENFPHARSVAHQMSLLPLTMMMPKTIHS